MTEMDDLTPTRLLSPSSSNEHHSRAGIVPDADQQEETGDIGLENMRTRRTGPLFGIRAHPTSCEQAGGLVQASASHWRASAPDIFSTESAWMSTASMSPPMALLPEKAPFTVPETFT
jgi:hypothetical protein